MRSYSKDGLNVGASGIVRHYLSDQLDVVVLSNNIDGAWPVVREIDERLGVSSYVTHRRDAKAQSPSRIMGP
ncbi:hypothetical protein BH11ACT4_BH11ACT4_06880 [soil metagenome]